LAIVALVALLAENLVRGGEDRLGHLRELRRERRFTPPRNRQAVSPATCTP